MSGREADSIPGSSTKWPLVVALNLPKAASTSVETVGLGIGLSFAQRETKREYMVGELESRAWPGPAASSSFARVCTYGEVQGT